MNPGTGLDALLATPRRLWRLFIPPTAKMKSLGWVQQPALASALSSHLAQPGSAEGMGLQGEELVRGRGGERCWENYKGVSLIPWAGAALPKPSFLPDPTGILMHCLSLQLHSSVRGRCCAGARAGFQANWILCLCGFPCRQATGISAVFLRDGGEQG